MPPYPVFCNNIVTGCLKENISLPDCAMTVIGIGHNRKYFILCVIPASGSHVYLSNDLGRDNYCRQMLVSST